MNNNLDEKINRMDQGYFNRLLVETKKFLTYIHYKEELKKIDPDDFSEKKAREFFGDNEFLDGRQYPKIFAIDPNQSTEHGDEIMEILRKTKGGDNKNRYGGFIKFFDEFIEHQKEDPVAIKIDNLREYFSNVEGEEFVVRYNEWIEGINASNEEKEIVAEVVRIWLSDYNSDKIVF